MTTPIDPEQCNTTGRLLTEWFEFPEYTKESLHAAALEHAGVDECPPGWISDMNPEDMEIARKVNAFKAKRKATKFVHGMSNQEVQHRLNEATKMIDPTNFKFLDDSTRERTGLEINPLWMMECLVRSGILTPKEQVAALKELASYTHSKAPNISHTTTTQMKPEDWLLELAKEEYTVVDHETPLQQPMQRVEKGMGKKYEKRLEKRIIEQENLLAFGASEMAQMEEIVDAEWEDDGS